MGVMMVGKVRVRTSGKAPASRLFAPGQIRGQSRIHVGCGSYPTVKRCGALSQLALSMRTFDEHLLINDPLERLAVTATEHGALTRLP
jgi:hypothetical protein